MAAGGEADDADPGRIYPPGGRAGPNEPQRLETVLGAWDPSHAAAEPASLHPAAELILGLTRRRLNKAVIENEGGDAMFSQPARHLFALVPYGEEPETASGRDDHRRARRRSGIGEVGLKGGRRHVVEALALPPQILLDRAPKVPGPPLRQRDAARPDRRPGQDAHLSGGRETAEEDNERRKKPNHERLLRTGRRESPDRSPVR